MCSSDLALLDLLARERRFQAHRGQTSPIALGKEEAYYLAGTITQFHGLRGFTQPPACFRIERISHHGNSLQMNSTLPKCAQKYIYWGWSVKKNQPAEGPAGLIPLHAAVDDLAKL